MFSFTLELLPQETIYSYVARTRLTSAVPMTKELLIELTGHSDCQLNSPFPTCIERMSEHAGLSGEQLIRNHTLFPYYESFLNEELRGQFCNHLEHGHAKFLHSKMSLVANRIPQLNTLKYCPRCVNRDLREFGVAYWHVFHQLPFTRYCPYHNAILNIEKISRREYILPPQVRCSNIDNTEASINELMLSTSSLDLLQGTMPVFDRSRLTECYLAALQLKGFCTHSLSIHQQALTESIKAFWRYDIHAELFSALFEKRTRLNYPRCIFYQPNAQHHPIKHLLLIGHLFGSSEEFLHRYEDESFVLTPPENKGNKAQQSAPNQADLRLINGLSQGISLRQAAKSAGVSVGHAKSLAIKNGVEIDRRAQRIFAPERKEILDQLKEGRNTADIALDMNCSVGVVEQLLSQHPDIKALRGKLAFYKKRAKHRRIIEEFLLCNTSAARVDVKKGAGAAYSWCYKNDKAWLYKTLPAAIPRQHRYKGR
ncbi:TnsD family Tn7-like transposition protein [Pseudoalteromonas pernae]|uniref:TnsD family Tn7-like transposition protein n=1 Tax=Pseudoalteromonas pernae TaxID=3118054 RepID=UPI0032421767